MTDAIDTLAGITPGSALDGLRRQKPVTRDNAQASFDALFAPASFGDVSAEERGAVALFVALLHQDQPASAFYRDRLEDKALVQAVTAASGEAGSSGPFGHYPPGPLSAEDTEGTGWAPSAGVRDALGGKLAAALAHAHMLVFHLRDAKPEDLRALEAAGWSADGIVTLSQLVAFLAFQIRAAFGLRALSENPA